MEIWGIPLAGEKKGVSFPLHYPNPAFPKAPTGSSPAHLPCLQKWADHFQLLCKGWSLLELREDYCLMLYWPEL